MFSRVQERKSKLFLRDVPFTCSSSETDLCIFQSGVYPLRSEVVPVG